MADPEVIIRVDASHRIGTGHVMRCLTLADLLREEGTQVTFICREHAGHLCNLVEKQGYAVQRLPHAESEPDIGDGEYSQWLGVTQEVDARQTEALMQREQEKAAWLIVDHYALDNTWERVLRPLVNQIMVIDDLADRSHDCDLLLDQNLCQDFQHRYDGLVSDDCRLLLGPQYALLRPEFGSARENLRQRDGRVRRLLIFFGGADATNETAKAIDAVTRLGRPDISVDVVLGTSNRYRDEIAAQYSGHDNIRFYQQVDNMAQLMADADLAIGAGGTTTWERCFLGLPGIVIAVADNQRPIIGALAREGAVWNLGWHEDVSASDIETALRHALHRPDEVRNMGIQAVAVMAGVDGQTVHEAVAIMMEATHAVC